MPDNPYESPQTEVKSLPLGGRVLTETMLFYLKGASPWLRFIGIMGFISLGFMVVQFITMIFAFGAMGELLPGFEGAGSVLMLVLLLVIGSMLFFPTVFVFQFGRKIRAYLHNGNPEDLELALKNNKSLWTYVGILMILSTAFSGIILAGVAGAAIAAGMSGM